MAAPTSFSNPLEKWIYHKSKESIFFIDFVPRECHFNEIRGIVANLKTVPEELIEERSTKGRCCTGIVVSEKPKELKILSSAHCLDHLFTKEKPKSAQELDKLYQIDVICDHREDSFHQDKAVNKKMRYSEARITEIDCEKDLMLLTVICVAGPKGRTCKHSHPALAPSKMTLQSMEKGVNGFLAPLQTWTVAVGEVSNCSREYDDISSTNLIGYDMTLVEVNIPSDKGGSGSPLLDSAADFIGLLHGGADGCSWFISLPDICNALTDWGVLVT